MTPFFPAMHSALLAFSLSFYFHTSLAAYDNRLQCDNRGRFPQIYRLDPVTQFYVVNKYQTIEQLCKFHTPGTGMGCVCGGNAHRHACIRDLSDPNIYNVDLLFEFCFLHCSCPENQLDLAREEAENQLEEEAEIDGESIASSDPNDQNLAGPYRLLDYGDDSSSIDTDPGSGSEYSRGRARLYPLSNRYGTGSKQCGAKCTNFKCSDRGRGCKCLAYPDVTTKGTWRMLGCAVAMASGRGRRSLDVGAGVDEWSCPCNASYVSHSCCDANDGLVWEAPSYKLGVLA